MNLDTNKELTMLTFFTNNYYSFDIFIHLYQWHWLEMAWVDWTSKMEHFDYFSRALHLEWLISSGYAMVYLTTFCHAVFSGVNRTSTSEVDSFFNYT